MSNHPNRSRATPSDAAHPTPAAIRAARATAGMSQSAAASVIHYTARAWEDWEQGQRAMPRAAFDLFLIGALRDRQAMNTLRARARAAASGK